MNCYIFGDDTREIGRIERRRAKLARAMIMTLSVFF